MKEDFEKLDPRAAISTKSFKWDNENKQRFLSVKCEAISSQPQLPGVHIMVTQTYATARWQQPPTHNG